MLGTISFEHLEVPCVIGVNPHERTAQQSIFVDLRIVCDFSECIESDRVHDTVDYVHLAEICTLTAQQGGFKLLETYASAVLDRVLKETHAENAWIRVKKPLGIPGAQFAAIELEKVGVIHGLGVSNGCCKTSWR